MINTDPRAETRDWDHSAIAFAVGAVVFQGLTITVGMQEEPNTLAALILQAVSFALGISGSYIFGRASARQAAQEIVRPHARAAFRRSVNLYRALDRQRETLNVVYNGLKDEARQGANEVQVVDLSAARWAIIGVQNLVIEQLGTARDSLEDWRDLVPDEVDGLTHSTNEAIPQEEEV